MFDPGVGRLGRRRFGACDLECRLGGAGRGPEHPYVICGVGENVIMNPTGVGRKLLTCYACFKPTQRDQVTAYLRLDQELHKQIRQLARFRLGCHKLHVESARHLRPLPPWSSRICNRCSDAHPSLFPGAWTFLMLI